MAQRKTASSTFMRDLSCDCSIAGLTCRHTDRQTGKRAGGQTKRRQAARHGGRQTDRQTVTGAAPEEALRQGSQLLLQVRRHLSEVIVLVADDTQQVSQAAAVILPVLA